jgi:hypothetical protein
MTASLCLTLLLLSTMAHAQQLPPRDTPRQAETGAGIIRGVVVDSQTDEPLPRAVVDLSRMSGGSQPTATQTDAEGRFEFRDLPPGRYLLSASRTPYLRITYGHRGADSRGTPIEVAVDGVVDRIRLAMQPGGVISGRVYDEFGHPAVGIRVQPLQYRYNNGRRELMLAPTVGFMGSTDDRGAFRIWGLRPGQYFVSAAPEPILRRPRCCGRLATSCHTSNAPRSAPRSRTSRGSRAHRTKQVRAPGRIPR